MSKEARVGFIGLLALIAFFILVPSSSTRDSKILSNTYNFVMSDGDRITVGSDVKLAGISVGTIDEINFTTPGQRKQYGEDANIIVTIHTDAGVYIPINSVIDINTAQTGNFWLDIQPGTSQEYLKNGSTVLLNRGVTSHGFTFDDTPSPAYKITAMTKEYRDTLSDPKFKSTIQDLASNARFYTNELKIASEHLDIDKKALYNSMDEAQISAMQQIDRINVQIDMGAERLSTLRPRLHEKTEAFNERLKSSQKQIDGMMTTAQRETERFKYISQQTESKTAELMGNPQYRAKLRKAAHKLDNLARTTEDIKSITSEPSVREGLQNLVHQYREQSEEIKNKLEKWEKVLPGEAHEAVPRQQPAPSPVAEQ